MNSPTQPSSPAKEPFVLAGPPSGNGDGGPNRMTDGARRVAESRTRRPDETRVGGSRRAFLRAACRVLASALAIMSPRDVAWALCFPDSKVSFLSPARGTSIHPAARPHPPLVGLRTRRRGCPFPGHPAGALAAVVRVTLRGVRRRQERRGGGRGSPPHQIPPQDGHASRRDYLRPRRGSVRPLGAAFWGAGLTVFHGFGAATGSMANLAISNAVTTVVLVPAILLGGVPRVGQAAEGPVPPACLGSGPRRHGHGGGRGTRVRSTPRGPRRLAGPPVHAHSAAHLGGSPPPTTTAAKACRNAGRPTSCPRVCSSAPPCSRR